MTDAEFGSWIAFFELFPFDDYHVYHRPAALISASMSGEYEQKIEFLQPQAKEEAAPIKRARRVS